MCFMRINVQEFSINKPWANIREIEYEEGNYYLQINVHGNVCCNWNYATSIIKVFI